MTRVCALANKIAGRHMEMLLALEKSLDRKGVPFFFYLEGGPWSWKRKVEWEREVAAAHPEDHFVFIDAFDYLFVGEKAELDWVVTQAPLIFSADAGPVPWPDPDFGPAYEKRRDPISDWRWVNGSGPAGLGSAIVEAAEYGLQRFQWAPVETDQSFWGRVYLSGYGELDQTCTLTQTLYDGNSENLVTPHLEVRSGRLRNTMTLSRPQFIHASGHSWVAIPEVLLP